MTNEERRIVRDGFGAIEDELRQQRYSVADKLNKLIEMVGGDNAKIQAIREDLSQLQESNSEHERKIAAHARQLAALPSR